MENIIDITQEKEQAKNAEEISNQVGITFKWAFWLSIFFCATAVVIFIWQQWKSFSFGIPINNDVFGTLGDFVGGILGTIIALYSVYMLVRTFQNQIVTNGNVIITNLWT